jgi:hypothetical protein
MKRTAKSKIKEKKTLLSSDQSKKKIQNISDFEI